MSYGMHDYLAEKAMQSQYMQKRAADSQPEDFPVEYYIERGAVPTNPKTLEEYNRVMGMRNMQEELDRVDKEEGPGEQPTWASYYMGKLRNGLSRSRAFLAEHPEILYGLGGAGIGAGIGALVSPKRRLLGSLIGLGVGGALGAGGKLAWDKWGEDIKHTLGKPIYRRIGDGLTPRERKFRKEYNDTVVAPAVEAYKGGYEDNPNVSDVVSAAAFAGTPDALMALSPAKRAMMNGTIDQ